MILIQNWWWLFMMLLAAWTFSKSFPKCVVVRGLREPVRNSRRLSVPWLILTITIICATLYGLGAQMNAAMPIG